MKRMIKAAAADLKDYTVIVNFAGYIGVDEEYNVFEENEDDAIWAALEEAKSDLSIDEVEEVDDGEYEVHIGFAGFMNVEEIYTVYADNQDDAEKWALADAADDLSAEIATDDED